MTTHLNTLDIPAMGPEEPPGQHLSGSSPATLRDAQEYVRGLESKLRRVSVWADMAGIAGCERRKLDAILGEP